ncbi:hypothetical protein ACJ72_04035 [Emergomyces africanus]|uniref:Cytochrome P450 n=1 Tax=Emergomyces africanus TaxID=1955775 RepID=A0A1B7NXX4_9EURO|nr:hypothetical protein ACJ72_04035 [Emergomyces africanus]
MSVVAGLLKKPSWEFLLEWCYLIAISILVSLMISTLFRSMYRSVKSPFPGPKLAKWTGWWLRWHELRDGILNTTHRAHRDYGAIVQLSPRMVSFCHPDAIKDIYTGPRGGLDTTDIVWFFERYGSQNVVSTVDAQLHLMRRKNVAGLYSSPIATSPAFQAHIKKSIDALMNEIGAESKSKQLSSWTIDTFPLMRWLTADIMIGLIYGPEKSLNLLSNPDSRSQMDELLVPTMELISSPLATMFQWLPLPIMKLLSPFIIPGSKLTHFGMSLLAIPNINYIASDSLDHFTAGTTTTADFLSALLYQLSIPENKCHQDKLRQELRTLASSAPPGTSTGSIPSSQLQSLPYLNGVLRETFRISPPIPFSLPRVVKTKDQDVTVLGMKIDPGTIISIQPHTLHRDPKTFPNPEIWDPERWQVPITSPVHRHMQRMLMPFGYGQRMCTGMNVAWAIIRQVMARIYIEYETSLDEGIWFEEHRELIFKGEKQEKLRIKKKNLFPEAGVQPIVFRKV